jgi:hypothetical protein
MSGFDQHGDLLASDQLGFGLLASGDDLFDLSHLPDTDHIVAPAALMAGTADHALAGDLVALDVTADLSAQGAGIVQLAGLDRLPLTLPAVQASGSDQPAVPQAAGHFFEPGGSGHVLALDDILAQAADDLASFHTAAGGPASHTPMGSGFFAPFAPTEALGGLGELHVLVPG